MTKTKLLLAQAHPLAEKIRDTLAPACERVEIAGSVRRQKATVGDIEIVAIPKYVGGVWQPSLFADKKPEKVSELDHLLNELVATKQNFRRGDRDGKLFKNFILTTDVYGTIGQEIGVDLFITTRAQWGYILALRTGPGDFNRAWVTQRSKGGLLPDEYRFAGGWLIGPGGPIDTPDERGFFEQIGVLWIEPHLRDDWGRYCG